MIFQSASATASISASHVLAAWPRRIVFTFDQATSIAFASAKAAGCDAVLTKDRRLTRVSGLRVLILDDLEPVVGSHTLPSPGLVPLPA